MAGLGSTPIPDGEFTAAVYRLIRDSRYAEVVQLLGGELQRSPRSRAGLSLLGYCYYRLQEFTMAAECYEQLSQLHPELEQYRLYQAQALYKACLYPEATRVAFLLSDNPAYHSRVLRLQAAIKYSEGDLPGARGLVEQLLSGEGGDDGGGENESDGQVNLGCLLYKEGQYEAACSKFFTALQASGYRPDLSYNLALAYYSSRQYAPALKHIADIVERGIRQHPELGVGMTTEGIDVRSVGNTLVLHQTALVEAFNLKAAIEYQLRNYEAEARHNRDDEAVKKAVNEYDDILEKYIPVLMAQAKIYWNLENYSMVEKIFRKSVEFCNDHDVWKLNVAHVLFMQENKYKEAIGFYEPIVKKHYNNILNVSAIVLANLCVSYIMTSQNEEAEELMRKIEKEEEQLSYDDPDKKTYHLCIVNLVIGTLYCAKGNYDFGISRVIKSLEPYNKKLGTDTWYYAKRCFLSLLENMSKHTIMLRDSVIQECIQFLEHCELYGRSIPAVIEQPLEEERMHIGKNTVTYESRQLKALIYEIIGWNM
ncbi:PREDICTED: tetratricopeptide repeat protein 30B-like [Miniopterus natalensis]|uniref:tetratricopeptide repeat protein 30B-like n=1 Tax=Miniopterus natalensis TaxID=291302 RepID=UPI0007A6F7AC|nr:PREDICTED: tetratricopeptide repeat protein 30B-like [Miniopterus natalensis]